MFVGALANYLSGKVASLSAVPASVVNSTNLIASARIYSHVFREIVCTGGLLFLLTVVVAACVSLYGYCSSSGSGSRVAVGECLE